jgi:hypothetical protein
VQGTAAFHHQIADTLLPQADPVFDDATTLDTALDVLDTQPTLVERLVRLLLLPRELLTAEFLGRHEDRHLRECERQAPEILQEPAPRRQGRGRRVRNGLIMGAAAVGVTEEEDEEQRIHEQDVFYRVVFFLAALTRGLLSRVWRADDPPFGPIMGKMGETGAAAGTVGTGGGSSSTAVTTVAASASETPRAAVPEP